jgi:aryl-alcohol dehydrogenase-like predicted oxidoreductase
MRYRALGAGGLVVSEVGFGTWRHVSRADQRLADRLVRTAYDLGITLFDTARSYGDAEEALGRALRGVRRESYVLSTKIFYNRDGGVAGLSRRTILSHVDGSLRDLKTDRIDLLSAHRFDPDVPLEETMATFGELIAAGKIRCYGFSEWTAEQITRAGEIAGELGIPPPAANQPQYSVVWRVPEGRVLPVCRRLGIGTVAFWPLAQGALTGKYRPGVRPDAYTRAGGPVGELTMRHLMVDPLLERVELFARLARRQGMTAVQLAMAWVLNRGGVAAALVGASAPEQLRESASASGVRLTGRVMELIDKIFAGCVYDDTAGTG